MQNVDEYLMIYKELVRYYEIYERIMENLWEDVGKMLGKCFF